MYNAGGKYFSTVTLYEERNSEDSFFRDTRSSMRIYGITHSSIPASVPRAACRSRAVARLQVSRRLLSPDIYPVEAINSVLNRFAIIIQPFLVYETD